MDAPDAISLSDLSDSNPNSPTELSSAKRKNAENSGRLDISRKRIKMRDLDSVFRSEDIQNRHSDSLLFKEAKIRACGGKKGETSLIKEAQSMHSDTFQEVATGQNISSFLEAADSLSLGHTDNNHSHTDLRTNSCNSGRDATLACVDVSKSAAPTEPDDNLALNIKTSSGLVNGIDVSSRVDQDQLFSYKISNPVKSRASSECGSSTGPLEENEPMRMWKAMKENGFLSSTHGGIPVPKQRCQSRKSKSDVLKKNMELAKREQVSRFTKIAAPSGLLTGLNPGIINHVRNSKQVHSIIEALVRSEKRDGCNQNRQPAQLRRGSKDDIHDTGADQGGLSHEGEPCKTLLGSRRTGGGSTISLSEFSNPSSLECKVGAGESCADEESVLNDPSIASQSTLECEDVLALKLTSAMTTSLENAGCMPIEGFSPNPDTITSLSLKAATVASQWLEILHQDLRGRLAALQCSRKRVREVIRSEYPSLLSYELTSNRTKETVPDSHYKRWISLFNQMDKALYEEGKHLESLSKQVKEMQLHCERGLQYVKIPTTDLASSEKDLRSKKLESLERENAVRAAAASIYSTCSLVMSTENVSCF